jgi:hypothetical protein
MLEMLFGLFCAFLSTALFLWVGFWVMVVAPAALLALITHVVKKLING